MTMIPPPWTRIWRAAAPGRVVDQHVHAPVAGDRIGDQRLAVGRAPDVPLYEPELRAGAAELVLEGATPVQTPPVADDTGALQRKKP